MRTPEDYAAHEAYLLEREARPWQDDVRLIEAVPAFIFGLGKRSAESPGGSAWIAEPKRQVGLFQFFSCAATIIAETFLSAAS